MLLLDKQEIQDIFEHTAVHARKWSGFICKRDSEDTTLYITLGQLKKEEEIMINADFLLRVVKQWRI